MARAETKDRLYEIMRDRNLRQVDLAKKCAESFPTITISKNAICQYLSGKSVPSRKRLFVLASVLNVNPAWLLGADVDREGRKPLDDPDEMKAELVRMFTMMDAKEKVMLLSRAYEILKESGKQ